MYYDTKHSSFYDYRCDECRNDYEPCSSCNLRAKEDWDKRSLLV